MVQINSKEFLKYLFLKRIKILRKDKTFFANITAIELEKHRENYLQFKRDLLKLLKGA
jgi:hypothetical protein